jgi:hypothetical protein
LGLSVLPTEGRWRPHKHYRWSRRGQNGVFNKSKNVYSDEKEKMVTSSLVELNIGALLGKVEQTGHLKLPKKVIEVTLEPDLDMLCIRFVKPSKAELGEPLGSGIQIYRDMGTRKVTAVEIVNFENL